MRESRHGLNVMTTRKTATRTIRTITTTRHTVPIEPLLSLLLSVSEICEVCVWLCVVVQETLGDALDVADADDGCVDEEAALAVVVFTEVVFEVAVALADWPEVLFAMSLAWVLTF